MNWCEAKNLESPKDTISRLWIKHNLRYPASSVASVAISSRFLQRFCSLTYHAWQSFNLWQWFVISKSDETVASRPSLLTKWISPECSANLPLGLLHCALLRPELELLGKVHLRGKNHDPCSMKSKNQIHASCGNKKSKVPCSIEEQKIKIHTAGSWFSPARCWACRARRGCRQTQRTACARSPLSWCLAEHQLPPTPVLSRWDFRWREGTNYQAIPQNIFNSNLNKVNFSLGACKHVLAGVGWPSFVHVRQHLRPGYN